MTNKGQTRKLRVAFFRATANSAVVFTFAPSGIAKRKIVTAVREEVVYYEYSEIGI